MKIALVQPFRHDEPTKALGLAYIHQSLLDNGHQARQFDVNTDYGVKNKIARYKPDFIGVGLWDPRVQQTKWLFDYAKSLGIPTIIGGPSVTRKAEECLRTLGGDIAVSGDGVVGIHYAINGNFSAPGISRIVNGEFKSNGLTKPHLDSWPTPFYGKENTSYAARQNRTNIQKNMRLARLISTVGCYADCSFCFVKEVAPDVGSRSAKKILEDMVTVAKRDKPAVFQFQDDNSFMNPRQLKEVLEGMDELGIRQKITYATRSNQVRKNAKLYTQHKEKFETIFMGIESFVQPQLDRWSKGTTREDNLEAVDLLLKNGITPGCYMICFDPTSKSEEVKAVTDFYGNNPFYFFYTYPLQNLFYPDEQDQGISKYFDRSPSLHLHYVRDFFQMLQRSMSIEYFKPYTNYLKGSPGLQAYQYEASLLEKSQKFFEGLHEHSDKLESGELVLGDPNRDPFMDDVHNMVDMLTEFGQSMFIRGGHKPRDRQTEKKDFFKIARWAYEHKMSLVDRENKEYPEEHARFMARINSYRGNK